MQKIVALDYDDTYTLSPNMWNEILKIFNDYNYHIYIITYRQSTAFEDMVKDIPFIFDTIFTNGNAKQKYCKDCDINIDIWIDDSPETIIFGYKDLPIR
ncbi:MAG: hypothetical protein BV456_09605 [Thermoplasmata archaeon M8B2D]|nr:MAG: hypothetical protein BV456_09605 [Thermoplasmata archaeon M8B2D]